MVKNAFTLIELIFAIVVMAIAVMSLPVMARITSQSIETNLVQEAIFAGSSELMGASSGYWDTNSMLDTNVSHISRVIDIGVTCENNASSDRHRLRIGHVDQPLHRKCVNDITGALAVASIAVYPDLNDAAHGVADILEDPGVLSTEAQGYKQLYKSDIVVALDGTDNNIKHIVATIYEDDGVTELTILRMQSANIGEIDYYKRRF